VTKILSDGMVRDEERDVLYRRARIVLFYALLRTTPPHLVGGLTPDAVGAPVVVGDVALRESRSFTSSTTASARSALAAPEPAAGAV
jgi:hypothetical protein